MASMWKTGLGWAGAVLFLGCTALPPKQPDRRPNILFLIADDQSHDALSCLGHPWLQTPNIDRIAEEGVLFSNAFVTTSLCTPSRASFFTGRYARSHGVIFNTSPLPPGTRTFAQLLGEAGYDSAYFGKWHVGGAQRGRVAGFRSALTLRVQGGYDDSTFWSDGQAVPTKGFTDDRTTDFAVEYLRRPRDEPFLVCVGFKSPHRPREPAARFGELYADAEYELAANATNLPPFPRAEERKTLARRSGLPLEDHVPEEDWAASFGERPRPPGITRGRTVEWRKYLRLVAGLDENVGRLLDTLDELGIADETIVVYASDHGFGFGGHGVEGKATAYEESMRTILLMRHPGLESGGRTIDELVLNIDLAPTLLECAGVEVPPSMQGQSLHGILGGSSAPLRSDFLYEFYPSRGVFVVPTTLALRERGWKLITYPGHPGWSELYDLAADPQEMHNLAGEQAYAGQLARLTSRLAAQEEELGPRP